MPLTRNAINSNTIGMNTFEMKELNSSNNLATASAASTMTFRV